MRVFRTNMGLTVESRLRIVVPGCGAICVVDQTRVPTDLEWRFGRGGNTGEISAINKVDWSG